MTFVLLTGAGFSRNWGGWLASEAFEYLLGCSEIDDELRKMLWKSKSAGGFEDTLSDLQGEYARSAEPVTKKKLDTLESALVGMFNAMDNAFEIAQFENIHDVRFLISAFLNRFDAIFTLNQDLLLELHYFDNSIALSSGRRFNGWQMPGTRLLHPNPPYHNPSLAKRAPRAPDKTAFQEQGGLQPYYKLHGSSNWRTDAGERMLVMGGNKSVTINQHPLLSWYNKKFVEYLGRPQVRLMVIGYSFSDEHINRTIMDAAGKGHLQLFIVDPQGVDVLDKLPARVLMRVAGPLMTALNPHLIGASRRSLRTIFGSDPVEFGKLMRFFDS